MYDTFSSDYDRFVNWKARLSFELPFIEQLVQPLGAPPRLLDAACGTGMHAIALAQRGYPTCGADLSAPMIERARENAAAGSSKVRFETAGFGQLAQTFGRQQFDAVLCLGNSLPHVITAEALTGALADFAACLRPGGLLLVQNRNFDAVMASKERWMEPQAHREGDAEWIFLRFYDYEPEDLISFNIVTLRRKGSAPWEQQVTTTRLRPQLQAGLVTALQSAGFEQINCWGSMNGAAFEALKSGNLIVTAYRA